MVTCADALEEAVKYYGGVVTSRQIFDYFNRHYPNNWKEGTIRAHIMGCTVNHSSSHHYKNFRKFLYSMGPGQVRLYEPETDGIWKWTKEGMIKIDDGAREHELVDLDEFDDVESEVDSNRISLTMERDLELFLYNNISSLDSSLDLPDDIESRQPAVESGRLDILAKDSDGAYVVIELKAGLARDQALTQLLAYMGDIAEQYNANTRGILVAHEFSDRLVRAAQLIPSVKLMKYTISFSFEPL